MHQTISVFVNGILGVFVGMAVLYLTIKLISLVARHGQQKTDKDQK